VTRRAKKDRLHCGKTASLFAITNSGYPLCGWQAIAKSRQLLEQRLGLLKIERIEAFGEPAVDRSEKIARDGYASPS
jgi:hypothetical protein